MLDFGQESPRRASFRTVSCVALLKFPRGVYRANHFLNIEGTFLAMFASQMRLGNFLAAQTGRHRAAQILKASFVYFALVFGAGFILGPIRILIIVPRVGQRAAELLEAPLMLVVVISAARWVVRRFHLPHAAVYRLAVGLLALIPGLLIEFALVLRLRGLTLTEYFQSRDPVAATVYYLTLGLFAIMPLLVGRKSGPY